MYKVLFVYINRAEAVMIVINKPKRIVTQDNILISASYSLTLDEKRLLLLAISKLKPNTKIGSKGKETLVVNVSEWKEAFKITSNAAYTQLKSGTLRLYERSIKIIEKDETMHMRWVSSAYYNEGAGSVTLVFSGDILKYLSGLVGNFTSFDLINTGEFTSIHSFRVYEMACRFIDTGWLYIEIGDFKTSLGIEGLYSKWAELKRRVIDKACKEINKHSNLSITYDIIKSGRSVVALKFKFTTNSQIDLFTKTNDSEIAKIKTTTKKTGLSESQEKRKKITAAIMDIHDTSW